MEHGRFDEALREIRRAEEIDPLSPIIKVSFCQILREARRPSEALSKCLEAQDLDPGREPAHSMTAQVYASMMQYDKAISEYEKVLHMRPDRTDLAALGAAYASAGRRRDAMRVLNGLVSQAKTHYVPPADLALIYIALGERDSAFAWLDRARVTRDVPADIKFDPGFDPIRGDPRFAVILRALGLQ
jgi:tetratricopeptide (TPR) repeat protein